MKAITIMFKKKVHVNVGKKIHQKQITQNN